MAGFNSAVILTALPVERKAMLEHVDVTEARTHRGTIYEIGRLRGTPDFQVAVAEIGPGNDASAIHVERASSHLNPDLIAFVGVAGGIKDVRHGDVVIASKIYGYESGKAEERFLTRPTAYRLVHVIEQQVMQSIHTGDWVARLPCERQADPPAALLGAVASGEAVIASKRAEIFSRIKQSFNDTVAVEMEGRGLAAGAAMSTSLPFVDVRGISDLIDDKTQADDEARQPVAAANAAAFATSLLSRLAGEASPLDRGDREMIASASQRFADAYYVNVPRLLADPSALGVLTGWGLEALRTAKAWGDLGFEESMRLRHLCERALDSWQASALPLEQALSSEEVGARVVFSGHFRTRNWKAFDPQRGLTGDLRRDPHVYMDVAAEGERRRVSFPLEPAWAVSTTAQVMFNSGSVSLSGVGLLRLVEDDRALVSPYLLAPPLGGGMPDVLSRG